MIPFMDKAGLELALLSKFVLACQSTRLADAADQLNQTTPALSMALHRLEERLGMKLFMRRAGGLHPLPSAFWLFRTACQLLYLEQHAREARGNEGRRLVKLSVELDVTFAIGRVSKAVLRSCQHLITTHPELLVEWRFAGIDDDDVGGWSEPASPEMRPERAGHVRIFYQPARQVLPSGAVPLHEDPWIVVGSRGSRVRKTAAGDPLSLLRMRPELMDAIAAHADRHGLSSRLQYLENPPDAVAEVMTETPHLRLLMPGNLLPARLGLARHDITPFDPPLTSSIYGVASGGLSGHASAFLGAMAQNMADERAVVYAPLLDARHIHYFNLAVHTGSISAAARVANTAQPSVSKHLSQMESVMGAPVLLRTEEGATVTPLGEAILPFTSNIEERQDWIFRKAHDIAAHSEARVTIGTLPSSGHDSALTEKIAHVVTRIHARHPDWQLQVFESSNSVLHERVRAGELNLAVVGKVNPQVARIRLGPSEQLCVIGNPAFNFGGRQVLDLADACALPLVLGRHHLSIHQSFADAARERSLRLRSVVEVGSLALAIAMVRQAPLCTILPASSVRQDIASGSLVAIPISQEELTGALSVIFSAERVLSDAERIIVHEFVRVFRPQGTGGDDLELARGF